MSARGRRKGRKTGHFSRVSQTAVVPSYKDSVYWTKILRFTNESGDAKWDITIRVIKHRLNAMSNITSTDNQRYWWQSVSLVCMTAYGPFMNSNLGLDSGTTTTDTCRVNGLGDIAIQVETDFEAPPGSGNYPDYFNGSPQMSGVGVGGKRVKLHWTWSEKDQGTIWSLSRITDRAQQSGGVLIGYVWGVQGNNTSIATAARQDIIVDITVKLWTKALQLTFGLGDLKRLSLRDDEEENPESVKKSLLPSLRASLK